MIIDNTESAADYYRRCVLDYEKALNHIADFLTHTYGQKPEQPAATYIEDTIKTIVSWHIVNNQKLETAWLDQRRQIEQLTDDLKKVTQERDAAINGQDWQAKIIGKPVTELETKVSQLTAEKVALVKQLNEATERAETTVRRYNEFLHRQTSTSHDDKLYQEAMGWKNTADKTAGLLRKSEKEQEVLRVERNRAELALKEMLDRINSLNSTIECQVEHITDLRNSRANWRRSYEQERDAYKQLEAVYNKTLGRRVRNKLKSLLGREE